MNIFWFRRDLRLEDNTGLFHALNSGEEILPIFIFDDGISTLRCPDLMAFLILVSISAIGSVNAIQFSFL